MNADNNPERASRSHKLRHKLRRLMGGRALEENNPNSGRRAYMTEGITAPVEGQPSSDFKLYEIESNTLLRADQYVPKNVGDISVVQFADETSQGFSDEIVVFTRQEEDDVSSIAAYNMLTQDGRCIDEHLITKDASPLAPIESKDIFVGRNQKYLHPKRVIYFYEARADSDYWADNRYSVAQSVESQELDYGYKLRAVRDGIVLADLRSSALSEDQVQQITKQYE